MAVAKLIIKRSVFSFISIYIWGVMPGRTQRWISRVYADVYNKNWSKKLIKPYCKAHYNDPNYLEQFIPASGAESYKNFQDFFTRLWKTPPSIQSQYVWACEGLLCEYGKIDELSLVRVKGQTRHLRTIFGAAGEEIPEDYYFSNVFLHNNNYHRIHAPINGTIKRIEHIPGDLVLLRPWAYKNPSLPALRNERINVDIEDEQGRTWYLSIVGGPGVGAIVLGGETTIGSEVGIGNEIATFLLGSTCCIATPEPITKNKIGDQVYMGDPIQ